MLNSQEKPNNDLEHFLKDFGNVKKQINYLTKVLLYTVFHPVTNRIPQEHRKKVKYPIFYFLSKNSFISYLKTHILNMNTHTHVQKNIYIQIYTHTHTYINIHLHICIYVFTHSHFHI